MNKLIWMAIACSFGVSLYAQQDLSATAGPSDYSAASIRSETRTLRKEIRKFPALYSGFAIELNLSATPLHSGYPIFRQFGQIQEEHRPGEGYSYLIAAKFESPESAIRYLKEMILHRAPQAKIFWYDNGNRNQVQ